VSPTTRVYWTLDYLGLGDHTSILNGGLVAWEATHHAVSTESKQPATGSITPAPRKEIVADAEWVSHHLNQPAVTIIDARNHEFYNGSQSDGNPRSGHIPGATNLVYLDRRRPGPQQIHKSGCAQGIISRGRIEAGKFDGELLPLGQRATVIYFTARMLAYDAKMYDGSWEDWSHRKDLPIVTGESPNKQ